MPGSGSGAFHQAAATVDRKRFTPSGLNRRVGRNRGEERPRAAEAFIFAGTALVVGQDFDAAEPGQLHTERGDRPEMRRIVVHAGDERTTEPDRGTLRVQPAQIAENELIRCAGECSVSRRIGGLVVEEEQIGERQERCVTFARGKATGLDAGGNAGSLCCLEQREAERDLHGRGSPPEIVSPPPEEE